MAKKIIVSNRLPVTVKKVDGKLEYKEGGGGLATALSTFTTKRNSLWIGWPGMPDEELTDDDKRKITAYLKKKNCHPIWLTKTQLERFYNGYSNSVLWPLFHDMEVVTGDTQANWDMYKEVNQLYADTTLSLSDRRDTIWVHDYQLLMTPEMIRVKRPKATIGFFLHIPFPSGEHLFKTSHAHRLLKGMLGADVVGTHTPSYAQNFLDCCKQKGIGRVGHDKVSLPTHVVRVTDFPISINYDAFASMTQSSEVAKEFRKLQWKYRGKKVILMSDRMDPAKGLLERLTAYQTLLRQNPKLRGKVVMAMIAMPSRGDIEVYRKLQADIRQLVDDINNEFRTRDWRPIDAQFDSFPFAQYAALYRRADVAFIAPIRDGMNLVAKEFLASADKHDGVLVLSETAGAAEELKDAIMVNPNRPKTLVEGLHKSLTMPKSELRRRTANMQRHIQHFNVDRWVDSFMTTLENPHAIPTVQRTRTFNPKLFKRLRADYNTAERRLIMLSYDGTLSPYVSGDPAKAKPSTALIKLLGRLNGEKRTDVVILSGRSKEELQNWFGDMPIGIAAEHGAYFRRAEGKNWHKTSSASLEWIDEVAELFEDYASQTPGAHVERKSWALSWHYRGASPYHTQKSLVALRRLTRPILKKYDLVVQEGNKVFEILPREITKGRIAQEWLLLDQDFVLCIGDDVTDEDMFRAVPPTSWTMKVGRGPTEANYRLKNVDEVLGLLKKL